MFHKRPFGDLLFAGGLRLTLQGHNKRVNLFEQSKIRYAEILIVPFPIGQIDPRPRVKKISFTVIGVTLQKINFGVRIP